MGTSTDAFMASFVLMAHAATDQLLSSPGTTSFVLVGTHDPAAVREHLAATGLSVLDRDSSPAPPWTSWLAPAGCPSP